MEEKEQVLVRRTKLQEAILVTLASGGYKSSALIPEILNYFFKTDIQTSARKKETIKTTATRLVKKGLLTFSDGRYHITKLGQKTLQQWQRGDFQIKRPKHWDGKWRIVIFDIPEKRRNVRDEIRNIFVSAGFVRLQDSVWVYPYDCEDIIGLLKTDLGVGRNLLYIIADQIENDKYLRMDFDLIPPR